MSTAAQFGFKDAIDILTVVFAACAFGATFWQGRLARKHNRLVVRPHLVWHRRTDIHDHGVELTFTLENNGVGPALVKERYFLINGSRFVAQDGEDEIEALVRATLGEVLRFQLRQHGIPAVNAAIPAESSHVLARLYFPGQAIDSVKAVLASVNVGFRLRYESLYEESFKLE